MATFWRLLSFVFLARAALRGPRALGRYVVRRQIRKSLYRRF